MQERFSGDNWRARYMQAASRDGTPGGDVSANGANRQYLRGLQTGGHGDVLGAGTGVDPSLVQVAPGDGVAFISIGFPGSNSSRQVQGQYLAPQNINQYPQPMPKQQDPELQLKAVPVKMDMKGKYPGSPPKVPLGTLQPTLSTAMQAALDLSSHEVYQQGMHMAGQPIQAYYMAADRTLPSYTQLYAKKALYDKINSLPGSQWGSTAGQFPLTYSVDSVEALLGLLNAEEAAKWAEGVPLKGALDQKAMRRSDSGVLDTDSYSCFVPVSDVASVPAVASSGLAQQTAGAQSAAKSMSSSSALCAQQQQHLQQALGMEQSRQMLTGCDSVIDYGEAKQLGIYGETMSRPYEMQDSPRSRLANAATAGGVIAAQGVAQSIYGSELGISEGLTGVHASALSPGTPSPVKGPATATLNLNRDVGATANGAGINYRPLWRRSSSSSQDPIAPAAESGDNPQQTVDKGQDVALFDVDVYGNGNRELDLGFGGPFGGDIESGMFEAELQTPPNPGNLSLKSNEDENSSIIPAPGSVAPLQDSPGSTAAAVADILLCQPPSDSDVQQTPELLSPTSDDEEMSAVPSRRLAQRVKGSPYLPGTPECGTPIGTPKAGITPRGETYNPLLPAGGAGVSASPNRSLAKISTSSRLAPASKLSTASFAAPDVHTYGTQGGVQVGETNLPSVPALDQVSGLSVHGEAAVDDGSSTAIKPAELEALLFDTDMDPEAKAIKLAKAFRRTISKNDR